MKQFAVLLLMVGMSISMAQAQKVVAPTNPNEACEQAWTKYQKADKLWKAGWGLFGIGGAMLTTVGVCTIVSAAEPIPEDKFEMTPNEVFGGLMLVSTLFIGSGVVAASIPCICVGHVRRKNALEEYNIHCAQAQEPLTFSVQASQNGVGLALTF